MNPKATAANSNLNSARVDARPKAAMHRAICNVPRWSGRKSPAATSPPRRQFAWDSPSARMSGRARPLTHSRGARNRIAANTFRNLRSADEAHVPKIRGDWRGCRKGTKACGPVNEEGAPEEEPGGDAAGFDLQVLIRKIDRDAPVARVAGEQRVIAENEELVFPQPRGIGGAAREREPAIRITVRPVTEAPIDVVDVAPKAQVREAAALVVGSDLNARG